MGLGRAALAPWMATTSNTMKLTANQKQVTIAKGRCSLKLLAALALGAGIIIIVIYTNQGYVIGNGVSKLMSNRRDVSSIRPVRFRALKKRLPQCIIIGVAKGGTAALRTFLKLHPDIRVADEEIDFFGDDRNYRKGLEWYRNRMPESLPWQITMEKTPGYFVVNSVPERIHHMNSSIKMILLLREPTERAVSDYLRVREERLKRGLASPSFASQTIDGTGRVRTSDRNIEVSTYSTNLKRWYRLFPKRQILVLSSENLVKNPANVVRKVETFLNLEHKITRDMFYFNPLKRFYCLRKTNRTGCLKRNKGRTHPAIPPHVREKLNKYFRPYNNILYKMVGRDFGWP